MPNLLQPAFGNSPVQRVIVEKSTRRKWVKLFNVNGTHKDTVTGVTSQSEKDFSVLCSRLLSAFCILNQQR